MTVEIFTTSTTWTCPADITSVAVECWGAGAGGSSGSGYTYAGTNYTSSGRPGGGGAYSKKNTFSSTPTSNYTVSVGTGGISSWGNGVQTYFNDVSTVLAKAGTSNTGGASASGVGDIKWSGGTSGASQGSVGAPSIGGIGGSSSAGIAANGTAPSYPSGYPSGSTGGAGAVAPAGGGNGGNGGSSNGTGGTGVIPGGGGGGGAAGGLSGPWGAGGVGAVGQVRLTYGFVAGMLMRPNSLEAMGSNALT